MEFLAELHPKVVHFPVALLLVYALLELIGAVFKKSTFTNAAFIVLIIGFIGTIAAMVTGEQAAHLAEEWDEIGLLNDAIMPYGAIDKHEDWASITLWYFLFVVILRSLFVINFVVKKKYENYFNSVRYGFAVLSLVGCFFIYETGERGGELVYKHGIGTELIKPDTSSKKENKIEHEKLE